MSERNFSDLITLFSTGPLKLTLKKDKILAFLVCHTEKITFHIKNMFHSLY